MIQKVSHQLRGNRKAQALAKRDFHVRHPHHFARQVEQRSAAVPRIDLRARLQIQLAFQLARLGAQDALRDRALQPQRTADGEHRIAHVQRIRAAQRHMFELRRVLVLDVQQRQVMEFVDRDDLHLLVRLAFQLAVPLVIDFHRDLRLALDHMEIRDEITVLVQEKSGAQPHRRLHLHHGFADHLHQRAHIAHRRRVRAGRVKIVRTRRSGCRDRIRGARLADAHDEIARHHQHGEAHVQHQGVRVLRQNLPGERRGVFQQNGVSRSGLPSAGQQRS